MRSGTGTKSGAPCAVTRATKSVIDFFTGPSFQEGRGSPGCAIAGAQRAITSGNDRTERRLIAAVISIFLASLAFPHAHSEQCSGPLTGNGQVSIITVSRAIRDSPRTALGFSRTGISKLGRTFLFPVERTFRQQVFADLLHLRQRRSVYLRKLQVEALQFVDDGRRDRELRKPFAVGRDHVLRRVGRRCIGSCPRRRPCTCSRACARRRRPSRISSVWRALRVSPETACVAPPSRCAGETWAGWCRCGRGSARKRECP